MRRDWLKGESSELTPDKSREGRKKFVTRRQGRFGVREVRQESGNVREKGNEKETRRR